MKRTNNPKPLTVQASMERAGRFYPTKHTAFDIDTEFKTYIDEFDDSRRAIETAFDEYISIKIHLSPVPVVVYRSRYPLPYGTHLLPCCKKILTALPEHPDAFTRHCRSLLHIATMHSADLPTLRQAVLKALSDTNR